MGVRVIYDRIIDAARDVGYRIRDGWDWARDTTWKSRILATGVLVAVCAVVAAVIGGPDEGESTNDKALTDVLVVQARSDLPSTTWSGWTQRPVTEQPTVASPAEGITAQPTDCVPGGAAQQRAQKPSVSGNAWVGTEFTNPVLAARATVMIARNDVDVAAGIDGWLATCAHAVATEGAVRAAVDVRAIGIDARTYRLDMARLVAQSVTPEIANAGPAKTGLTAIGRSGAYVLTVMMAFPGPVTDEMISVLDTLWRAQSAKLVGYRQAGKL